MNDLIVLILILAGFTFVPAGLITLHVILSDVLR